VSAFDDTATVIDIFTRQPTTARARSKRQPWQRRQRDLMHEIIATACGLSTRQLERLADIAGAFARTQR
jgi:hypothetical protein